MHIGCLHTAESNRAVFEAAAQVMKLAPGTLRHAVRPDLLAAAEEARSLTPAIAQDTARVLRGLCTEGSDAVLLTCSTLGPVVTPVDVTPASAFAPVPVLRVDAALADAAVRQGGRVAVLYAVETTREPTRLLFEQAAAATGATIDMQIVPDAWIAFKAGRHEEYADRIATAADAAFRSGAAVVALAQASMAGAAMRCREGTPLTSPGAGLLAALKAARARRQSA